MDFTSPRATLDELLEFCQAVRKAGGGNPLDALMPAVPQDQSQCLIAKNLNFNCEVYPIKTGLTPERWIMWTAREIRDSIAEELGLEPIEKRVPEMDLSEKVFEKVVYGVILPDEIAQVAHDFDLAIEAISFDDDDACYVDPSYPSEVHALADFWEYIDASVKESWENATFINEKGELVL